MLLAAPPALAEAVQRSEDAGAEAASSPARRSETRGRGRTSRQAPATVTLPSRASRRARSTTRPSTLGRSSAGQSVANFESLGSALGGAPAESGPALADAGGMVRSAAGRVARNQARRARAATPLAAATAPLALSALPESEGVRSAIRRQVEQHLTTISAPAPAVHRQVLDAAARLEARRDSEDAPAPEATGGGAKKKDLDEFLRRAIRRILVEESIDQDRDLTPWS